MIYFVTGASGFIGSHVVELLEKDRRWEVKRFVGDITKPQDCIRNCRDVDVVFNLAALTYLPPSDINPQAYMDVNFNGVVNLLNCREMFTKFVQVSSSFVNGSVPQDKLPIRVGGNQLEPQDPYGIAKLAAEKAVVSYAKRFGFEYLIIRPFNNFGPRQSKHFVIPHFIMEALKNKAIVVRGNTVREFVYVKDTASIMAAYLNGKATGIKQVCRGEGFHVADIANMIADLTGASVSITESYRPNEIPVLYGIPSDSFAQTPMPQAIKETVEHYEMQL